MLCFLKKGQYFRKYCLRFNRWHSSLYVSGGMPGHGSRACYTGENISVV